VRRKDLADYRFLGGHHNVVLAVLAGDFDAGAVKDEVFQQYAPKGLRALADTPAFSDHVFVTRATLPADTVRSLRAALLRLKSLPEGAAIMRSIKKDMTALIPAADSDYDNLRTVVKALESRRD
jgi:phosphonate transport system substrate-binding protein